MLALVLMTLLGTPPPPGSRWTWTLEDVRAAKLRSAPRGMHLTMNPSLDKSVFQVAVNETGTDAPKKLTLSAQRAPARIVGQTWAVESSYGEAMLHQLDKGWLDVPPESVQLVQRAATVLIGVDPIVTAASTGEACDQATTDAIAAATAKVLARLSEERPSELTVKDAGATCVGKKGGAWSVHFTISAFFRDQTVEQPWTGTIEVAPGAWHANLDLRSTSEMSVAVAADKKKITVALSRTLRSKLVKQP